MKYGRFEDLPVWRDAIELAVRTFALTAKPCFRGHAGTRNQLENAVVSIYLNNKHSIGNLSISVTTRITLRRDSNEARPRSYLRSFTSRADQRAKLDRCFAWLSGCQS